MYYNLLWFYFKKLNILINILCLKVFASIIIHFSRGLKKVFSVFLLGYWSIKIVSGIFIISYWDDIYEHNIKNRFIYFCASFALSIVGLLFEFVPDTSNQYLPVRTFEGKVIYGLRNINLLLWTIIVCVLRIFALIFDNFEGTH